MFGVESLSIVHGRGGGRCGIFEYRRPMISRYREGGGERFG